MIDIFWAEPFSTVAFWSYVILCVVSVWYWLFAELFYNKKRWFLLSSVLGGVLYLLISLLCGKALYPAVIFPFTSLCLFCIAKWKSIHFIWSEYVVGSILSLLANLLFALLLLTPYFDAVGLK